MLGISDPLVFLAYILCIVSAAFCVIWGLLNWNKGDEPVQVADVRWAKREEAAEEDL